MAIDGLPQSPCTAEVTGAGGLSLLLDVTYGSNTDAGTATADASFAGGANHEASSGSSSFVIDKASSSTVVVIVGGKSWVCLRSHLMLCFCWRGAKWGALARVDCSRLR